MSEFEQLVMQRLDNIELLVRQSAIEQKAKFLTLKEVQIMTSFGRKMISKYMESGLLKYSRFGNGHYRFKSTDVEAFMKSISTDTDKIKKA